MERARRRGLWLCLALLLGAVLGLCALFPLTGDDWFREALGAVIHSPADLAREVFVRWNRGNARILGNVLAYSAACHPLWRTLLRAGVLYGVMAVCWRLGGLKGWGGLLATAAAVLALPRVMFREVYPWGAGFFNYVPPVLLILTALLLMGGALEGSGVPDGAGRCTALFWLGLCGQLFMENDTVYALLAGAALLALDWVRQRRPSLPILLFLLGAGTGAVLLFSSPAYRSMGVQGGSYQSALAGGLSAVLDKAGKNLPTVLRQMLTRCPLLYGGLTAAALLHLRRGKGRGALRLTLALLLTAGAAWFALEQYTPFDPAPAAALAAALVWTAALLAALCLLPDKVLRTAALFYVLSAGAAAAPLLAVSPIGPRCLYLSYILLLTALLRLVSALPLSPRLAWGGAAAAAAAFCFYLALFVPIHRGQQARQAALEAALDRGAAEVTLSALPHEDYLWHPDARLEQVYYYETPGDLIIRFEGGTGP